MTVYRNLLLYAFLIIVQLKNTNTTHFEGAHFWYRPDPYQPTPNRVEIGFRIAWRISFSPATVCSKEAIASGALLGPETPGSLNCLQGCQGAIGDVSVQCIHYSVLEDWMIGVRNYSHTFPNNGKFTLEWSGQGWFWQNSDWRLVSYLNLAVRTRTGRINSTPRVIFQSTRTNVQIGCNSVIKPTIVDDDAGDVVRCRWSEAQRGPGGECSGVCKSMTGATLDQGACSVSYDSTTQPISYVLALQIEDFDPSDSTFSDPLSSVPLHLRVNIIPASTAPCNQPPAFVSPTPDHNSYIYVDGRLNNSIRLTAQTKDSVTVLTYMESRGPDYPDVTHSDVTRDGSNYVTDVELPAPQPDRRDKRFCFVAIDMFGHTSSERCFTVSLGNTDPKPVQVTSDQSSSRLSITFDQDILRPSGSKLIRLYDAENKLLSSYDTSKTAEAEFSSRSITLTTPSGINPTGCYYILMQQGAAVSGGRIPYDSVEILDIYQFNFRPSGSRCNVSEGITSTTTTTTMSTTTVTTTTAATVTTAATTTPSITTTLIATTVQPVTSAETVQPTTADNSTNATTFNPVTSGPDRTPPVQLETDAAATDSGGQVASWDYRWLIVAIVVALAVFAMAVVTAVLARRSHTRRQEAARKSDRQRQYFGTLNVGEGVENWSYRATDGSAMSLSAANNERNVAI